MMQISYTFVLLIHKLKAMDLLVVDENGCTTLDDMEWNP